MFCYTCQDCPTVTVNSPFLVRSCDTDVHSCVTVSVGGRIFRGCYQDKMKERCDRDKANCEECKSPSCNSESYTLSCHHCTPFNAMCAYTQQDVFACPCKQTPENIGDKFECYSLKTWVGSGKSKEHLLRFRINHLYICPCQLFRASPSRLRKSQRSLSHERYRLQKVHNELL